MENTSASLPLATRNPISITNLPGVTNPVASIGRETTGTQSWMSVLKSVQGSQGGAHRSGINTVQTSNDKGTDGFGVASSSGDTSVDSFGVPSVTPSSTSQLVSSISDPFSSIASNLAIQAQFGSQSFLNI